MKCVLLLPILFFFSFNILADGPKYPTQNDLIEMQEAYRYLTANEITSYAEQGLTAGIQLDQDFKTLQQILPEIYKFRIAGLRLFNKLKQKIDQKKPLNGRELKILHAQFLKRMKARSQLLEIMNRNLPSIGAWWQSREKRYRGALLFVSSMLTLLDNYAQAIAIFAEDTKLRRILNEENISYGKEKDQLYKELKKFSNFDFIFNKIHSLRFYTRRINEIESDFSQDDSIMQMGRLIQTSETYKTYIKETRGLFFDVILEFLTKNFWLSKTTLSDGLFKSVRSLENSISWVLGNAAGEITSREGKLLNDKKAQLDIEKTLRPLDILVEKTPFRLTDKFIPGFWGHVAIWIGNEAELKELGIWEHPQILRHHAAIREGRSIVEAIRPGVQINSVEHFMNIDDVAIMRKKTLSRQALIEGILIAASQVGKKYDYNFDVNNQEALICSEVPFLAYPDLEWNITYHLGRYDLIPDNVATQSLTGGKFSLELFYRDGKKLYTGFYKAMYDALNGPDRIKEDQLGYKSFIR